MDIKENQLIESSTKKLTGLELLRVPFEAHQISKLPKATKSQNEKLKNNWDLGIRCKECGGWHLADVVHIDYVGHAALTDRLLEADVNWNWEPLAFDPQTGLPRLDQNGNMWIKLTVCGVTRLGYGSAPAGKDAMDRNKELIGDALRNAAMRFGAALDLWHKGDLHLTDDEPNQKPNSKPPAPPPKTAPPKQQPAKKGRFTFSSGPFKDQHFKDVPAKAFEELYNSLILKDDPKAADILARMGAFLNGERE
jgi:hypothetical protein